MSTPASPASGFIDKYKALPEEALDAVTHPIDTLEGVLGIGHPAPPAAPQQANQSFQSADEKARERAAMAQRFRDMTQARSAGQ